MSTYSFMTILLINARETTPKIALDISALGHGTPLICHLLSQYNIVDRSCFSDSIWDIDSCIHSTYTTISYKKKWWGFSFVEGRNILETTPTVVSIATFQWTLDDLCVYKLLSFKVTNNVQMLHRNWLYGLILHV